MRILLLVFAVLACAQARAATLRTTTTLHGPNVYLRDLFDNAGPDAGQVLGPGPDPGGRIVVGAAQLNAIARQYDVDWRSASRADRAVLDWPAHPMRKQDAIAAVRSAITVGGGPDDIDIDMPGFAPPLIPEEVTPVIAVSQLDQDTNTGRFTAILTVSGKGMNPIDTRVSGRAAAMMAVPVVLTRLPRDAVIQADDLRVARVPTASIQDEIARSADQIVGMQLRRPIAAGQPLRLADLTRPPLVQRGSMVRIELSTAGLAITGQAMALDSGADGEKIRVQNMASHAFLLAQVIGPGQVRVMADAPGASRRAPPRFENGPRLDNRRTGP